MTVESNALRQRVQRYRDSARALRDIADAQPDGKEKSAAVHDAEMWERMADWEEKNPPAPD